MAIKFTVNNTAYIFGPPFDKTRYGQILKKSSIFYAILKCIISLGTALFHLPTKKLNFKDQLRQLLTKINVSSKKFNGGEYMMSF